LSPPELWRSSVSSPLARTSPLLGIMNNLID
jgi:hypothetical protein